MNKIFIFFFPIFVFAMSPTYWWIHDMIYLKKDYLATYNIKYQNNIYKLKFRWTLYKNGGLVMHYIYQKLPYQNILYLNNQLNGYKKYIISNVSAQAPYFMIYFRNFNNNIAQFEFLIYNPKKNIVVKLNNPKYRNKKWVEKLPPLNQKMFEGEIE